MNSHATCSLHSTRALLLMGVLLFNLSLQAQSKEVRFSLSIGNATLEEFVKQIERATGFSFVYGEEVRLTHRITLEVKQQTISEVLQQAFEIEPIRFEISGRHILLQTRPIPQKTVSRKFTISGYVTDGSSSETLIGANVFEKRQHAGTATNPYGFYSITLPQGEAQLTVSYLGYASQKCEFKLNKDTVLNIHLQINNQLQEVVILSDKKEAGIQATGMGTHEIPMAQIKMTPSILGEADLLKTVQLMPGVQAGVEGFSGLYVRGGGPDQNLILLDGIPVYNADHLMGVFSIFTPEAIKKVDLFKSSFPARYGGRLSSIVDVRTNDGDMRRFHGTLSLGLLTDKVHLEGPIVKDRTAFLISARGTHTAFLSNIIKSGGDKFNYYFYDINAKINHKFNDRNRLFLSFYHGKDHFHAEFDESNYYDEGTTEDASNNTSNNKNSMNWGNTLVAGRWNHVFSNKLFSNTTVAYNSYRMLYDNKMNSNNHVGGQKNEYQYSSAYRSGIHDWSYRTDFDYTPIHTHHVKFGGEYIYHTFRPETTTSKSYEKDNDQIKQDTIYQSNTNSNFHGHEINAYVEDNFDIGSRLSMNVGVHLSLFNTQGKNYFSIQPRLSAHYRFNNNYSIKASFSQMAQYVHLLSSAPLAMPTDLWVPITRNIRPMQANQYSLGGYYTGLKGWEFSLEGYYKQMRNVLEYQDGVTNMGSSVNWEDKVEMGKGRSMGVEFMVQRTLGKTTGWMAYTLAKSDRQFRNGTINNGARFPYKFDRRHNISICLNHKFSSRIDVGATWTYLSGGAITIPEQETVILNPNGELIQAGYISNRNNYRLPASHRLNLGVNFNKKTKHGMRTWNISLYNAYNAMNPTLVYAQHKNEDAQYYPDGNGGYIRVHSKSRVVVKKLTILPCIPSVSYTYRF